MNFLPKLESFEGPLDLLLHLIEKNKIDIYDIPIAKITDQYMGYLDGVDENDTDFLSEFLVMAATLIEIKSKMLLPADEENEEDEDPREELVKQLLEYKLFKHMSLDLKDMETKAGHQFFKEPSLPDEVSKYSPEIDYDIVLEGVTAQSLSAAFRDILKRYDASLNTEEKRYGRIKKEEISLPEKINEIRSLLKKSADLSFCSIIEKKPSRENIIVTFLAVLELMRIGEILAVQKGKDILISAVKE